MATAVFFHAHPDDEAIVTGGTMLLASRAGHRVVAVCATDGSRGLIPGDADERQAGETPPGNGDGQESERARRQRLATTREAELRAAARVLGVHRVETLGYRDSGMAGDPANDDPECFWQADIAEAAHRVAGILIEEDADLLTVYDSNGNYGHPDHIQVHRVGVEAAAVAGVELVYEATLDREQFRTAMVRAMEMAAEQGLDVGDGNERQQFEAELAAGNVGVDPSVITHEVDVRGVLSRKREAMAAHASQIPADSLLVALGDEALTLVVGTEWYVQRGATRTGLPLGDVFTPLPT